MKIGIKKVVEVDVKSISLCLKVRDDFTASFHDADGEEIGDYEGYVPQFMPGQHHGDYVMLDIDIETGQILNWVKPDPKAVARCILNEEDEE